MTLLQLRYLAAIADAGLNITVAARNIGATQPGVSKQLRQIEDELGFQLFVRRGKSLEAVTNAGQEVLDRARVILAETGAIRALAVNQRGDAAGTLRIAASHTQARFVLPEALAAVRARFPGLRIDIFPSSEAAALERLARQEAEVALVSNPDAAKSGEFAAPLYRWRLRAIVQADHPLARGAGSPTLQELARGPLVTYDWGRDAGSPFVRTFAEAGLTPAIACTAADAELIKSYVRAGLGIGVVAEMAVSDRDDDLAVLDLPDGFPSRTAWALVRRGHMLRAPILHLLSALAPHLDVAALRSGAALNVETSAQPPRWRDLQPADAAARKRPVRRRSAA
jgi:DNA-binding transcriptional LysR family regulator